jgi:hypothetical protein
MWRSHVVQERVFTQAIKRFVMFPRLSIFGAYHKFSSIILRPSFTINVVRIQTVRGFGVWYMNYMYSWRECSKVPVCLRCPVAMILTIHPLIKHITSLIRFELSILFIYYSTIPSSNLHCYRDVSSWRLSSDTSRSYTDDLIHPGYSKFWFILNHEYKFWNNVCMYARTSF